MVSYLFALLWLYVKFFFIAFFCFDEEKAYSESLKTGKPMRKPAPWKKILSIVGSHDFASWTKVLGSGDVSKSKVKTIADDFNRCFLSIQSWLLNGEEYRVVKNRDNSLLPLCTSRYKSKEVG